MDRADAMAVLEQLRKEEEARFREGLLDAERDTEARGVVRDRAERFLGAIDFTLDVLRRAHAW